VLSVVQTDQSAQQTAHTHHFTTCCHISTHYTMT